MKNNLKNNFLEFIIRKRLFTAGEKILVAVSGGVDSMALLHLLCVWQRRLNIELGVVHLHHGIRGKDADADMQFVKEFAQRLSLPFHGVRRSVPDFAQKHHLSPEDAGHRLREEIFEKMANQLGYRKIATAHHLDDQAETVLMRLISGTGLQGLSGIRLKKGKWVRPLLFASRSEIENYAERQNISFRTDATNVDISITRNKIRSRLLPLLQNEYNPGIASHLSALSELFGEWDDYLEKELQKALDQQIIRKVKNKINLELSAFKLYFSWIKIRLIKQILSMLSDEPFKISFNKLSDFIVWIENGRIGSVFSWGSGIESIKKQTCVVFYSAPAKKESEEIVNIFPENWYLLPGSGIKIKLSEAGAGSVRFKAGGNEEFIDGGQLKFPLIVRHWQNGDKFQPLGFPHSRLVSDFLTDRKIGRPERQNVQALLNSGEIVALLGIQISDNYRIQNKTKEIYRLTIKMGK